MPTAIGGSSMASYTTYPGANTSAAGSSGGSSTAPGMPIFTAPPGSTTSGPGSFLAGQNPASGSGSPTGMWTGFTSQGRQISFTVDRDAITSISVGYSISGCVSQDGTTSIQYNQPNSAPPAISDNSFYIMTPPATGMGIGFLQGTFTSNTSANGTLKMSLISLGSMDPAGNACAPSADATWSASKN
jgi:hypothetical protein